MPLSRIAFILLTMVALSAGQILFKMASATLNLSPGHFVESFFNPKLLIALVVYLIATVMWLLVLRDSPLRLAYPFAAIAFFLVPIFGWIFLGEGLHWNTFVGAVFIAVGVYVSIVR